MWGCVTGQRDSSTRYHEKSMCIFQILNRKSSIRIKYVYAWMFVLFCFVSQSIDCARVLENFKKSEKSTNFWCSKFSLYPCIKQRRTNLIIIRKNHGKETECTLFNPRSWRASLRQESSKCSKESDTCIPGSPGYRVFNILVFKYAVMVDDVELHHQHCVRYVLAYLCYLSLEREGQACAELLCTDGAIRMF